MSEVKDDNPINEEKTEETIPVEVIIKKPEEVPEPDVDYDDYLPTDEEILETEQEIEKITLSKKVKQ